MELGIVFDDLMGCNYGDLRIMAIFSRFDF